MQCTKLVDGDILGLATPVFRAPLKLQQMIVDPHPNMQEVRSGLSEEVVHGVAHHRIHFGIILGLPLRAKPDEAVGRELL